MHPRLSTPIRRAFATWLLCGMGAALAQPVPPLPAPSRITQVKVYPGSATVERSARVAAGSRSVTFICLPGGLDVQSLQVSADASVRLGETSVLAEPRALSAQCGSSALDGRIRELEERKDVLQAESDALGLVTGYLKGMGAGDGAAQRAAAAADPRNVVALADTLRRTGQDALLRQRQNWRQQAELDRQLAPLAAERDRLQGRGGAVVAVTVTLAAAADADIRLSYQIAGPGWAPTYRALLDTQTRRVRIERQALVAQATGEDWRGVKLLLSTGQPRRDTAGRLPTPWRIGIEPPPSPRGALADRAGYGMAAAAPAVATSSMAAEKIFQEPLFDVGVQDTGFATTFDVPQPIDVPSSGQRVQVALGQNEDAARLAVRTSPQVDPAAFLVADMAVPPGVWPAGALQLYRDGAFVGNGRWAPLADARLTLSFGVDELVRVQAEPERDNQAAAGFIGSRAERKLQRAYVVENRHRTPIALQVLEAAPVSVDEQVRVGAQFTPQPAELAWNRQPGLAMWTMDLDAGRTARFAADYTISYPKDARLQER